MESRMVMHHGRAGERRLLKPFGQKTPMIRRPAAVGANGPEVRPWFIKSRDAALRGHRPRPQVKRSTSTDTLARQQDKDRARVHQHHRRWPSCCMNCYYP